MPHSFECPDCGNPRGMFGDCPSCGSIDQPVLLGDTVVLNVKRDNPSTEEALDHLTKALRRSSELGIKAIILIHGYGSSGTGGKIKWVIHDALDNNLFSDRVDEYFFGEEVSYGSPSYRDLLKRRPSLKSHLQHFKEGNAGMTVLLLGSPARYA
jgi:hypothetical protein